MNQSAFRRTNNYFQLGITKGFTQLKNDPFGRSLHNVFSYTIHIHSLPIKKQFPETDTLLLEAISVSVAITNLNVVFITVLH